MAVLKCKMCGGDLEISEGVSVCECEYCGTKQTVPSADNEKKITLFGRANRLRFNNEFDKAAGVYESIVAEFPEEAEAYWGLVLCKYGIEYVDDPATSKKIPTCHRSSFESVMDDSNFEQALENADSLARSVYRDEAKQIEELRKGIIEVSSKEEPYDIFICYKETDDKGDRTVDSVIAQDVYTELTEKGYRVFFSRISLEDKLGVEYEPYIFAALNSAKIMLAFGTDYEYYNAVWVKNEWSRFLQLIARGKKKTLIPCYKGIDAYDMPKEFAKLQAQDMGKVGAIQDLLRGIEKILPRNGTSNVTTAVQAVSPAAPGVESLLERAFMFLEDGNWNDADAYCDKVLDIDPKCAKAYLGKLMAELHIDKQGNFSKCEQSFDQNSNYQKVIRFGDEILKRNLETIVQSIKDKSELKRKTELYDKAVSQMKSAKSQEDYKEVAALFSKANGLNDADQLARKCLEKADYLKKWREGWIASQTMISVGSDFIVGLRSNGTVLCSSERLDVSGWWDIVAVSAGSGHILGLRSDGTVIACGANNCGQCNVSKWVDIVAISAGAVHSLGLRRDGTVVACGENKNMECGVHAWKSITAISAGCNHSLGLKSNGTVVACGKNDNYQCDVEKWKNIVSISAGFCFSAGKCSNGIVVSTPFKALLYDNKSVPFKSIPYYEPQEVDYSDWKDIISVSAMRSGSMENDCSIIALHTDRTVSLRDISVWGVKESKLQKWNNTIALSTYGLRAVGLRTDGTVITNFDQSVDDWKLFERLETITTERENESRRLRQEREAEALHVAQVFKEKREKETQRKKDEEENARQVAEDKFQRKADELAPVRNKLAIAQNRISARLNHSIGVKSDGSVIATKYHGPREYDYGKCKVSNWENIIAVSTGNYHSLGLKSDGTVLACGNNECKQCNVKEWTNIIAIAACDRDSIGLKSDGRVVGTGCDINCYNDTFSKWENIIAISANKSHLLGLKSDGTVVACGSFRVSSALYVSDWSKIVAVSAGGLHSLGLRADGTVVACGDDRGACNVSEWTDVVQISAGFAHSLGLRADGTVIASGDNKCGQCNVSEWVDIVAISAGGDHSLGLKTDGTVVSTVYMGDKDRGQCDVSNWKLFNSIDSLSKEITNANMNRCPYCGGELKGLFLKKCVNCGKPKDY